MRIRLEREQPLTFLEFNYMILQSYDFRELNRRHGVTLQIGGSDQWGNIVCGMELTRRTDGKAVHGLTTPLITTASGAKMGKTAQGAVWLTGDRLSPYDYWQFWRNTEDADVGRFLRLFTDLPLPEIARLEALGGAEINEAKKVLATEATTLAHGAEAAADAAETARRAFEEGEAADTLPSVDVAAGGPGGRHSGVPAVRPGRPCRQQRRGAPADPRRRRAHQRRADQGRRPDRDGGRPARRRDQAVGRAQASSAGARGVMGFAALDQSYAGNAGAAGWAGRSEPHHPLCRHSS